MPLSPPAPRRKFHTRHITAEGFRRDDGGWDIEGHLIDTKSYTYHEHYRGEMPPGRPVHEMSIRLTLGDDMIVQAVETVTDNAPYSPCFQVAPNFQALVGVKVGNGWRKEVRKRVGRTLGCTHLVELLDTIATVSFQCVANGPNPENVDLKTVWRSFENKPFFVDGCHAWSTDSEVVRDQLPMYYTGQDNAKP